MAAPIPRRNVAIKVGDGEPLTRVDIQYDVLRYIFNDSNEVFTDPFTPEDSPKITFKDLYIKSILSAPKATKALKDKMNESPEFAEDYAMLSLLVNVGRINTTMSFFPEMKTAIRTYHPVPSLQRTGGNLQDAPRIKHALKSVCLEELGEYQNGFPCSPADVIVRYRSGLRPSTNAPNLIFVLANYTTPIGQMHFNGQVDFIDLFMRREVSSASRGRAFLWLCYNYLESPPSEEDDYDSDPAPNPFSTSEDKLSPPDFDFLSPEEMAAENQDSPSDLLMMEKLIAQRARILRNQGAKASAVASASNSVVDDDEQSQPLPLPEDEPKGKGKGVAPAISLSKGKSKRTVATKEKRAPTHSITVAEKSKEQESFPVPVLDDDDQLYDGFIKQRKLSQRNLQNQSLNGSSSHRAGLASDSDGQKHRQWYSPYPKKEDLSNVLRHKTHSRRRAPPRSIIQQAWQVIQTDPLVDSDEEGGDEHDREDYIQRLNILCHLSQPEHWMVQPRNPSDMDVETY
ncbi:hypothetical protein D9613_001979 [Agrocybe pediades]|uniref:Ino eighty subunit 1 n=1 Tax=Agrocybe pediades TaxID=84607 RepID=A0A8H4VWJ8_9AGAR|nr:hypothetical protein D9613_001979 [Agrocybe pediades]KAF9569763.1 hypothetical protein CPC08DRAFT_701641 [Agrocybe pediades]